MTESTLETNEVVTSFNLVNQPWIQCRMLDGTVTELSLQQVFEQAEHIREITGEVPTQTFALIRLLLAILYRALDDAFEGPEDWQRMWENGLPVEDVLDYLEEFEDRFDLLHPVHPFFQVADLRTSKGEHKDVSQLIFDLPAGKKLFTTRGGAQLERLTFSEAARWLVNAHAYDASGIKSGALGDPRVKGGRGYPLGVGWAGLLGGVFAEGTNVRETLLLNLVGPVEWEGNFAVDLPPWERPQLGAAEESDNRQPRGPVDLYTWQSRRIRLYWDATGVVGSLLSYGDKLTPQNQDRFEQMTAWRRSQPQEKKLGKVLVYMPREHDPARVFWRGISALLPKISPIRQGKDADRSQPPGIVTWLSSLHQEERLPRDTQISLRAIGVAYGTQDSVVEEVIDDRLHINLAVLRDASNELAAIAEAAVARAEESVNALKDLAANLAVAAGRVFKKTELEELRKRVGERAYAELDYPYRKWLATLNVDSEVTHAYDEWKNIVSKIIYPIADELVVTAGPQARKGRVVDAEKIFRRSAPDRKRPKTELINAPLAQIYFSRELGFSLKKSAEKEG